MPSNELKNKQSEKVCRKRNKLVLILCDMPWQKYLANTVRVHNYENVAIAAKGWQIILTLEEKGK